MRSKWNLLVIVAAGACLFQSACSAIVDQALPLITPYLIDAVVSQLPNVLGELPIGV
jgi:hypothetical protein